MAQKQISELSDEELKKNIKMMTVAVTVIIVSIIIMAVSAVYTFTKVGFSATTVLPFVFLPLAMINLMNLKKMKKELAARK